MTPPADPVFMQIKVLEVHPFVIEFNAGREYEAVVGEYGSGREPYVARVPIDCRRTLWDDGYPRLPGERGITMLERFDRAQAA